MSSAKFSILRHIKKDITAREVNRMFSSLLIELGFYLNLTEVTPRVEFNFINEIPKENEKMFFLW